jgi:hypothetical protein
MTTNCARSESTVRFVLAVGLGLFLSTFVHLHGSAVEAIAVPDQKQSSDSSNNTVARPGVCEREAEKLLGQEAVRIGRSVRRRSFATFRRSTLSCLPEQLEAACGLAKS